MSSPVLAANAANNARSGRARRRRWRPARAAAWSVLERHVPAGARVAVVGAGNADDLPLRRLARRAGAVDLVDLDARALRGARRRALGAGRVRARVADVTGGLADAIVAAAGSAQPPAPRPAVPALPGGPYDVVVADLVLTQLLYPALRRSGLRGSHIDAVLLRDGQPLTDAVVAALHDAAPGGTVVVLHDALGWWDGHPQPFSLDQLLAHAVRDPAGAVGLARRGSVPYGCDPWLAVERAGARVADVAWWRWPFAPGADYAVCALVTGRPAGTAPGA
ncbi:MAG TPA: hypothetical protein VFT50_10165 [Baekduia sp.]|nr:hypothetical protein [Baekduia sp.]